MIGPISYWMNNILQYFATDFGEMIVTQFDEWRRRETSQWTHAQTPVLQVVSIVIK